ncbi:unnamed protein product [Mycena citricolor]|uniref:Uncharacterized protein n=1 Tax=Mycena citricolor TaxID=2018698 RepID=A0AAD2GTH1_9AGAR|nr:unnamed protein product [Mycena citricolor]
MKFARYLEDTQVPEWQRAYIDYKLLKKKITEIRRQKELTGHQAGQARPSEDVDVVPRRGRHSGYEFNCSCVGAQAEQHANDSASSSGPRASIHRSVRHMLPLLWRPLLAVLVVSKPRPYSSGLLSALERSFFTTLDGEVVKIDKFFISREKVMQERTQALEGQLERLDEHRKIFDVSMICLSSAEIPTKYTLQATAHSSTAWTSAINTAALLKFKPSTKDPGDPEDHAESTESLPLPDAALKAKGKARHHLKAHSVSELPDARDDLDPDDFHEARHQLKKAVLEHYRGLEMLYNYRVLNLTGIRKALKKFEKVTQIAAQDMYMREKVDPTTFAADTTVQSMMETIKDMYASRFVRGDRKKALDLLRLGPQHKSHHVSTFWSGLFLGLAVPALVSGLYHSYQQSTRDAIPGWDGLLMIYGVFLIPVLLGLLVGLNILVWAQCRINYVFIFEFDLRTRMDHREYFQLPSIILAGLCYAFWLSFARIGAPHISPTTWPLVWLGFTAVMLFAPLPLFFLSSRLWLLRNVGKLLTSGSRRVEFTDFWMGDQFCSLVFTLSNLFLFVCLYAEGFSPQWRKCGTSSRFWPLQFALAILPFLVRLVQSLRRFVDSGLVTHLINGGKYFSGIIAYLCYFLWRHQGSTPALIAWCIFQALYSFYALAWDLWMDWSIMRLDTPYKLLRKELIYTNHIYLYYVAIVTNTLIRFIWVFYIPKRGPDMMLRTFIAGSFEMLRRWQWNFYRVENEFLGNVDQYRVTREVPLPYLLDRGDQDRDDEGSPSRDWRAIPLRKQRGSAHV